MTGDAHILQAGNVFVNTNLAAAVATVAVMCITWIRYKKPDVSMTLNGSLAGLVAITAGCDMVDPFGAALIGLIAGFVVVFGIEFIDKKLQDRRSGRRHRRALPLRCNRDYPDRPVCHGKWSVLYGRRFLPGSTGSGRRFRRRSG